jgi:hypothetical protein
VDYGIFNWYQLKAKKSEGIKGDGAMPLTKGRLVERRRIVENVDISVLIN